MGGGIIIFTKLVLRTGETMKRKKLDVSIANHLALKLYAVETEQSLTDVVDEILTEWIRDVLPVRLDHHREILKLSTNEQQNNSCAA